jgi:hypothetical protein
MIYLDVTSANVVGLSSRFQKAELQSRVRAVNYAAKRLYTASVREITSQVNLKPKYVRDRLKIKQQATRSRPEAIIEGRKRETRLATYGARGLTTKVKGRKLTTKRTKRGTGANPMRGYKGDQMRGIPIGKKHAGVSVKVRKQGSRIKVKKMFFAPLKKGKKSGDEPAEYQTDAKGGLVFGVFIRVAPGRQRGAIKHLYGPSVNQMFKRVANQSRIKVERDFQSEYLRLLKWQMEEK